MTPILIIGTSADFPCDGGAERGQCGWERLQSAQDETQSATNKVRLALDEAQCPANNWQSVIEERIMAGKLSKGRRVKEPKLAITVESHTSLLQEGFRRMAMAGAFERIVVVGDWTHFSVRGELPGGGCAMLVTAKGEWRRFLNPAAALALLRRMGVMRAEVEMREWDLELASLSMRLRPDVTARRLAGERAGIEAALGKGSRPDRTGEWRRLMDRKIRESAESTGLTEDEERFDPVRGREMSNRLIREFFGYEPGA